MNGSNSRIIAVAAALVALAAAPAHAVPVLDQSNTVAQSFNRSAVATGLNRAQTFTAGLTGQLTSVGVQLYKDIASVTGDVTLEIRNTSAGAPNASNAATLFTATISIGSIPDIFGAGGIGSTSNQTPFIDVDVSSAAINVASGDVLAISLRRTGSSTDVLWVTSGIFTNPYTTGVTYFRTNQTNAWSAGIAFGGDQGFRTFVDAAAGGGGGTNLPEPATLALFAIGLVGLGVMRRRRRAVR